MEMATPATTSAHLISLSPLGYHVLGTASMLETTASKVCLRAGSATVEVTALAPDLFRVGFFPHGRPASYGSEAVVSRDWEPGPVTIREGEGEVTIATSVATAHLSLDPLRIGFTDQAGRAFATDDPELGMGWLIPEQAPSLDMVNPLAILGTPTRVYKQHQPRARYFGCGERTGELEKTGTHQLFWNIDPPRGHTALQNNLYVSIPFTMVVADGQAWGLFLDSPARVEFDLAHEDSQRSWFGAENGDLVYYVFCGPTPQAVLERYTELTGRTPLPPLWSLGNGQSRFSYETAEEVRALARAFRERDIPCDTLYLDIDCLDGYRVFTWDNTRFPDPEGLLSELCEMGFHVVCIVDAGVKVDANYEVYTEGRERDLYCKTPQGDDYQNAVWPGVCVFPDFTNPQARAWWGDLHQGLLDAGITGIWSDMNEPALFIPLNSTMPSDVIHPGGGKARLHTQVHNAYGSLMVQATREGLLRLRPQQRPFIISRSGYAGVQRHALIWTGDNSSTWEHLAMSVTQLLNLGLSGVGWAGADVGGFYGDTSGELLTRWTEFGIFQPFCRNHSEKQTRHQEPWVFGEPYTSTIRDLLKLRQRLLPYLYTLFEECHRTGAPLLRPLFWHCPEDMDAYGASDQFLCGDVLLVAPITRPGAEYRHVYLPTGTWFHYWTGERFEGPMHILAHAPLGQPALYVRANTAIPFWPAMNYVGQAPADSLTLILYPASGSGNAALYEDTGDGYAYIEGEYARRTILCECDEKQIRVILGEQEGTFAPTRQRLHLELREVPTAPAEINLGDQPIAWYYDHEQRRVSINLAATANEQTIEVLFA
ncbi:alpha-glucosidase [Ktedonobacter sp. SOSP1-85]|uniref:glycoside hydrolase family 31 protein n=1 Tax=Ktedonobacter sp. SOSP1-85 TaxID=2778367 RepID=UPI0019152CD9|nr:glycoside hydrolase family 31 protein [Ktedonobacter sp. SOSP1-85]GHO77998.1 alpha-glucosidase [Ktedonobacter sp. SOSP1-85]